MVGKVCHKTNACDALAREHSQIQDTGWGLITSLSKNNNPFFETGTCWPFPKKASDRLFPYFMIQ